jgi:hypothetical protein
MASTPITTLLQDIRLASETHHHIVEQVRKLILASGADVTEQVKYGGILFSRSKPFCGVFAYAAHVTLEFSHGAALADKHKVLEGQGKLRRHIKLIDAQDIQAKQLGHCVLLAYAAAK